MSSARNFAMKLYRHLPVSGQNLLVSIEGLRRRLWRYGGRQREYQKAFAQMAIWDEDRLREYQSEKLRILVRHCAINVPWYRRQFRRLHIDPASIRGIGDLDRLPILTREDLRHAWSDLIAENWPRRRLWMHPSGGSTGMPLTIVTSRSALEIEYGFYWARRRPGMTPSSPFSTFTANPVVPIDQPSPPFWRDNWALNQRIYSVFHLSDDNMKAYVDDLNGRPVSYFQGYPSAVNTIAEWILRTGYRFNNPVAAFFSTSEILQPQWRENIETAFHTKAWDQYGQGEAAGSITEYACGHRHVDMDYGITELFPVGEQDGLVRAELVCTGLHDLAWPLLRYKVGDLVQYDPAEKCHDGHPGQIIRAIEGRTAQYFTLPDGRRITSLMGLSIHCHNTRSIQVIQERTGAILIHAVPAPEFSSDDHRHMLSIFRGRLGSDLEIDVSLESAPILSNAGKFLAIINRMPVDPANQETT